MPSFVDPLKIEEEPVDENEAPALPASPKEPVRPTFVDPIKVEEEEKKRIDGITQQAVEIARRRRNPQKMGHAIKLMRERDGLPPSAAYSAVEKLDSQRRIDWAKVNQDSPSLSSVMRDQRYVGAFTDKDAKELGYFEKIMNRYSLAWEEGNEGYEQSQIWWRVMHKSATKEDVQRLQELQDIQRSRSKPADIGWVAEYPVGAIQSTPQMFYDQWYALDDAAIGMAAGAGMGAAASWWGFGALGAPFARIGWELGQKKGVAENTFISLGGDAFGQAISSYDENGDPLDHDTATAIAYVAGGVGTAAEFVALGALAKSVPAVDKLINKYGYRKLLGMATKSPAARTALGAMGRVFRSGVSEAGAELVQAAATLEGIMAAGGVYDEQGNRLEDTRGDTYREAAVEGFKAGTVFAGALEAGHAGYDVVKDKVQKRRQSLVDAGKAVRNSDAAKNAPAALDVLGEQMQRDGVQPFTVSEDALVTYFQKVDLRAEEIDEQYPELAEALDDAENAGTEVPINPATLQKLMMEDEAFNELTFDLRVAGEQTPREVNAAIDEMEQGAEADPAEPKTEQQLEVEYRAEFEEKLAGQLSQGGSITPAHRTQAQFIAAFYAKTAAETGQTLEQFADRHKLEVNFSEQAGPDAIEQQDQAPSRELSVGQELEHPTFGRGTITKIRTSTSGVGEVAVLDFDGEQRNIDADKIRDMIHGSLPVKSGYTPDIGTIETSHDLADVLWSRLEGLGYTLSSPNEFDALGTGPDKSTNAYGKSAYLNVYKDGLSLRIRVSDHTSRWAEFNGGMDVSLGRDPDRVIESIKKRFGDETAGPDAMEQQQKLRRFRTSDGYTFNLQPDGTLTDNPDPNASDMVFGSLEELAAEFGEMPLELNEEGSVGVVAQSAGKKFVEGYANFMSNPADAEKYQQALNRQNRMRVLHGGPDSVTEPRILEDADGQLPGFSVTDLRDVADFYARYRSGKQGQVSAFDIDTTRFNPIGEEETWEMFDAIEQERGLDEGDLPDADRVKVLLDAGYNAVISRDPDIGIRVLDLSLLSSVPDNPNILFQSAVPRFIEGGVRPPVAAANRSSLENTFKFVAKKTYATGRDLKLAIQEAVLKAAGGVDLTIQNDANQKHLVKLGTKDALYALKSNANAVGWYDKTVRKATKVLATIHPEIETDQRARFAFTWALAVTSNGLKVDANFKLAERVYAYWKANEKFPETKEFTSGTAAEAMQKSLVAFNTMIDRFGYDAAEKLMTTRFTKQQLTAMGLDISGEDADTIVRGAAYIGPKIGNGFFSNLYGFFDALTIDRWAMRTWGRWTGNLVHVDEGLVSQKSQELMAAIEDLSAEDRASLQAIIKAPLDGDAVAIGNAIKKASIKTDARGQMSAIGQPRTSAQGKPSTQGNELRKIGNGLAGYVDGQIEMPEQSQRQYIRNTFAGILNNLHKAGYTEMTMADLQALLWYPEKRLYDAAKSKDAFDEGYSDDEAPDYANAAIKLARDNKVPEGKIKKAIKEAEDGYRRATAARRNDQGRSQSGTGRKSKAAAIPKAEQQQRRRLLKRHVFRSDRHRRHADGQTRAFKRAGAKTSRELGSRVLAKFEVTGKFKNVLGASELRVPARLFELEPSPDTAKLFSKSIKASKRRANAWGAAVYVYPNKSTDGETGYEDMRLFLTEDKRNGFALKSDGDIVSVFSDGGGQAHAMLELAIEEGGTKLDAFDTILPDLYSFNDFVEVGRDPWNETYKPPDWDKETFKDFNNGEPDIVYMEYRPGGETTRLNQDQPVFYSAVLKGVEGLKQPKAPGAQWLSTIKNIPGIKQEELDTLGLEDWLKDQKSVTKEDLIDYIKANQLDVQETVRGEPADPEKSRAEQDAISQQINEINGKISSVKELPIKDLEAAVMERWPTANRERIAENRQIAEDMYVADLQAQRDEAVRQLRSYDDGTLAPRWEGQYITPGGKNYKELVITLPGQIDPYKPDTQHFTSEGGGTAVAWIRFDERTGPDGERRLHIGEVQSKRHQDASKKGYKKKPAERGGTGLPELQATDFNEQLFEINDLEAAYNEAFKNRDPNADDIWVDMARKERALQNDISSRLPDGYKVIRTVDGGWALIFSREGGWHYTVEEAPNLEVLFSIIKGRDYSGDSNVTDHGVPDAPFKTTWHELAMKRMLRYAVDNGFDEITWDSGETQADRYDLSKQVDAIAVPMVNKDGTRSLRIDAPDGSSFKMMLDKDGIVEGYRTASQFSGRSLDEVIGKEMAEKVMAVTEPHEFTGVDLKVGGEFLKKRYDKDIPRYMAKLTKKMGGKVGTTSIVAQSFSPGFDVIDPETNASYITAGTAAEAQQYIEEYIEFGRNAYVEGDVAGRLVVRDNALLAKQQQAWSLPITDKMRETVSQGLPMFQTGDQRPRGFIEFTKARDIFKMTLTGNADLSTVIHESAHMFLEVLTYYEETGEASQQMLDDLKALREWTGTQGRFERSAHEQVARGMEAYVREGKAPSNALRKIFRRMRGWLMFVYQKATDLNVELSDEVREVFGRMLASDKEIARANMMAGRSDAPMPQDQMGLNDEEYAKYVELHEASLEEQRRTIEDRIEKEQARGRSDAFNAQVNKTEARLQEELEATQGYKVWRKLLDGDERKKLYVKSVPGKLRKFVRGLTSDDPASADLEAAAEVFNFDSGEAMISAITVARKAQADLRKQARALTEEAYGALDKKGLQEEAEVAIHNKQEQEKQLVELMALRQKASQPKGNPSMVAQMNAIAEDRVAKMTRRDMLPDRWRKAELRAAQESTRAAAQGDAAKAALAKRQQIMAGAMYRAMLNARKEVGSIRDKLNPFRTNRRRAYLGKAGDIYLDGIDHILEGVNFKEMSVNAVQKKDRLEALINSGKIDPGTIPQRLLSLIGTKNYKDMTLEELRAVHDAVMMIYHQAKTKTRIKDGQKRRAKKEIVEEMKANAKKSKAINGPRFAANIREDMKEKWRNKGNRLNSQLTKMESMFAWMDGQPSGGVLHRIIYQPLADAFKAEYDWMKRFHETIYKQLAKMPAEQKRRWKSKVTFMGESLTGEGVIAVALNWGNVGNREKLLRGYGWDEEAAKAQLDAWMTKEDWDMVQHIWKEVNTLWPDIERVTKKLNGLAPPKVDPAPFDTPFGRYEGGYYPVKYDPRLNFDIGMKDKESDELFANNFASPAVRDGFTNARTNFAGAIQLDLSVLGRHLHEVVHFVTHAEAIQQADELIRDKSFRKVFTEYAGPGMYDQLRPWLKDIARNEDAPAVSKSEFLSGLAKAVRGTMSVVSLGFNVASGLMQILGFTTANDMLPLKYQLIGIRKAFLAPGDYRDNWRFGMEKSAELEPLIKGFDRDIKMLNNAFLTSWKTDIYNASIKHAFSHIGYLQLTVNMSTWHGALEHGLAQGMTDQEAIRHADAVVRQTQSSGAIKDLSAVQRGSEISRWMTAFYTWFSILYQRLQDINRTTNSIKDVPRAAKRIAVLVFLTALLEQVGRDAWNELIGKGDEEEDEEEFNLLLSTLLKGTDLMIGSVPGLRAFVSTEAIFKSDDFFTPEITPASRIGAQYWRSVRGLRDLVVEEEPLTASEVKALTDTLSLITRQPVSGVYRVANDIHRGATGEELIGSSNR